MSNSVASNTIQLPDCWKEKLQDEFDKDYMQNLKLALIQQKKENVKIFPPGSLIFNAFNLTLFSKVKVVILGQDPYHGDGQAHGLSFSVPKGTKIPPSLVNIYKELKDDLNVMTPKHGNLENWAKQGILLLNTTLTVIANRPLSHKNLGWEKFTDKVIEVISNHKKNVVFVLWGAHAQSKLSLINQKIHKIIKSAHPSPLSAHRGFFGSKPFSQINTFLNSKGVDTINWNE